MMQADISRRSFLRGNIRGNINVIYPPWAVSDFSNQCERCEDCISVCQEKILVKGDGGYPTVNFHSGQCTFCGDCVKACQHAALDGTLPQPWLVIANIKKECLSLNAVYCRSCGDSCDQRAVEFQLQTGGRALPVISQTLCNGCGACVSVCPNKAIQIKEAA